MSRSWKTRLFMCFYKIRLFLKLRDSQAEMGFGQGGPEQVYRIVRGQSGSVECNASWLWGQTNGPVLTTYLLNLLLSDDINTTETWGTFLAEKYSERNLQHCNKKAMTIYHTKVNLLQIYSSLVKSLSTEILNILII